MKEETLKTVIDQRNVAFVTLNRPELHNAFNEVMIEEITKTFEDLAHDDSVRLVVLAGEGRSFCAGADVNWMKKMKDYSQAENYQDSLQLAKMFQTVNDFPKPVLGKISGFALGGGAGLAAVCDYVVATENTLFGFTEVALGLVPAVISPFVMAKIGESRARAHFLSGAKFSAQKAYEMGLIHEVTSDREGLNTIIEDQIHLFLKAAPGAAKVVKKLVQEVSSRLWDGEQSRENLQKLTCETISAVRVSAEAQEGMLALLEKRPPMWTKN